MGEQLPLPTIITQPLVHFGREICGDLDAGLRREWLVTNGLGGYASGTLSGINTRSYHGLLVAALAPPVQRTVLIGGLVEWATYDGTHYPLCAHEYGSGTIDPRGYQHLQSFALQGTLPVWVFALADALLERRVWMGEGTNTTYVSYRLLRGSGPVALEVTPLVTYRSFHALTSGQGWSVGVEPRPQPSAAHLAGDRRLRRWRRHRGGMLCGRRPVAPRATAQGPLGRAHGGRWVVVASSTGPSWASRPRCAS
jgi:glycogen debranching enzyme